MEMLDNMQIRGLTSIEESEIMRKRKKKVLEPKNRALEIKNTFQGTTWTFHRAEEREQRKESKKLKIKQINYPNGNAKRKKNDFFFKRKKEFASCGTISNSLIYI